jgi:hypothetical protein
VTPEFWPSLATADADASRRRSGARRKPGDDFGFRRLLATGKASSRNSLESPWERHSHPGRGASTPAAAHSFLRDDRSPGLMGAYPYRTCKHRADPRYRYL